MNDISDSALPWVLLIGCLAASAAGVVLAMCADLVYAKYRRTKAGRR